MMYFYILIIHFLTNVAFANQIHLAVEDSWPPFALNDGSGISTNIVRAALKEVGYTTKLSVYPYVRVLKLAESGAVDGCYNVTKQESTLVKYTFGKEPLMKVSASFFYKKGTSFKYKDVSELPKNIDIGVIRGYEYGDKFEQIKHSFHLVEVNTQQQLIKMLSDNRISTAIMFDKVADYYLKKMNTRNISKAFQNHVSDIFVAFSKKNPQSQKYAKDLDQGIISLKNKKKYESLLNN